MHGARVIDMLAAYRARYPGEAETAVQTAAFVARQPRCFERDCWDDGHITGSAWLVDGSGSRVLLTHHRKLKRWLQLGGHSDGDADTLRVACREAAEESGLGFAPVSDALFDIDIHSIPARASDPEHLHYDLRFALRLVGTDEFVMSDESHALAWVDIDRIHCYTHDPSVLRMAGKWLRQLGNN